MVEGKDKARIWDDCAQCAHKHLTAALAALTAIPVIGEGHPVAVPAHRVFYARALILNEEAIAGYAGNASLACGCLSMAELTCLSQEDIKFYRDLRLAVSCVNLVGPKLYSDALMEEIAAGNVVEALRELECLQARSELTSALTNGAFYVENVPAYRSALISAIRDIEVEFCLMERGDR